MFQTMLNRSRLVSLLHRRWHSVRIGCASGFWGDTAISTPQLLHGNPGVNYIVYDYLSEITMSLLAGAKMKNPSFGYCPDFVAFHVAPHIDAIKTKGVKLITNAGGLNPSSCAAALRKLDKEKSGIARPLRVAVVTGDDLMTAEHQELLSNATDLDSGMKAPKRFVSVNAYFGAGPIKLALDHGADVVITGRCVDSALALAPLMHEYGWSESDVNPMATGSLAGHLIECGAQATGGICTDWEQSNGWDNIGFPIVEFNGDSDKFTLTKPKNTGGFVNFGSVAEQLVYEIGDPAAYVLPDVTADFTKVSISETGHDIVGVSGATGIVASPDYKVSATYADGFRCVAVCPIIGPKAAEKGLKTANAIITKTRSIFKQLKLVDFRKIELKIIGAPANSSSDLSYSCMLWLGVQHENKQALEIFAREIAPAGTGMAPGLTNIIGGRPRVSPVLRLFSFMVPKEKLKAEIFLDDIHVETYTPTTVEPDKTINVKSKQSANDQVKMGKNSYSISQLAFTRSGDKGDSANIGVVARKPEFYPYLLKYLTTEVIGNHFTDCFDSEKDQFAIERFELPGIHALNFLLPHSLGGGGIASLRFDPQGKGYAQRLLDVKIDNLPDLL